MSWLPLSPSQRFSPHGLSPEVLRFSVQLAEQPPAAAMPDVDRLPFGNDVARLVWCERVSATGQGSSATGQVAASC